MRSSPLMKSTVKDGAADRPGHLSECCRARAKSCTSANRRACARGCSVISAARTPRTRARASSGRPTKIEWEYTPSEFAALLQELRLIKRFRPRYNVAMKRDARHYSFIKLTKGPAPKLVVVRGASGEDASIYYGPFVGAQRVGEAVRELNDAVMLRDCRTDLKMFFSDQTELFQLSARTPGCIRYEIAKCLGPCVGGCSAARVRRARSAGKSVSRRLQRRTARDAARADGAAERGDGVRARRCLSGQAGAARSTSRAVRTSEIRGRESLLRVHSSGTRRRGSRLSHS